MPRLTIATLLITMGATLMATAEPATVIIDAKTISIDETLPDPSDLWVTAEDLTRINGFVLKPEGACFEEICIPIKQDKNSDIFVSRNDKRWINLTELASRLNQAVVSDIEHRVWSFGEIPAARASYLNSAAAPDFELTDRSGKTVRLSDYRGKKVLLMTWASWCGCKNDIPGWQKVYEDLKDQGFELISVAEDTGGEEAAGKWFDRADPTFTQIVDKNHQISTLYNMVNVPTGVWIDEEGTIVRPNETAYSSNVELNLGEKSIRSAGGDYVAALKDWVAKGAESEFALSKDEVTKHLSPREPQLAKAEAAFQLGIYFHEQGNEALANEYWGQAQAAHPDSWNYHRQDWAFTPKEANANWMKKFQALDKEYYPALDLPTMSDAQ